jgi:hypothetical protein
VRCSLLHPCIHQAHSDELDDGPLTLITGCDHNGRKLRKRGDLMKRYERKMRVVRLTSILDAYRSHRMEGKESSLSSLYLSVKE